MSCEYAIEARGLSKSYRLAHLAQKPATLLQAGVRLFSRPRLEEFWALKDVSFAIEPGEVVGLVGGNGSGKSTLLKILSRVTKPSSGEATLDGTVASLLELGAGFHPELTGRENIFLAGAILGLKRRDISPKFDAIVDFAGIERFLDTPVKRFSSGMFVRLAFSVLAHFEFDVMLLDEVLAVGDAEFREKSFAKLNEIVRSGRTILLVSHEEKIIRSLCKRAILLEAGQAVYEGTPDAVLSRYHAATLAHTGPLR